MSQLVTQTTTYGLNSDQYSISTLSSVGGVLEIMAGNPHDEVTAPTPIVDFKSDKSVTFYGVADLSNGVTLPQKIIGTNQLADKAVTSGKIADNVTIVGTLTGTASRATADGEGNNIVNTYATKDALTTVENKLPTYATKASPTFTGTVTVPTPSTSDNSTKAASTAFVKAQGYVTNSAMQSNLANYLPLTGGTLSGNLNLGGHHIENAKSIEMITSAGANHGGFIDFHFNGSTKDYTSRIIESAEGKIDITAPTGVYANGKNIVRSVNGTVAGTDGNVTIPMVANSKGYVTATWVSGTSGYRKWSDGYIEQWGQGNSFTTLSLPTAFSNTNYCLIATRSSGSHEQSLIITSKTTTTIYIENRGYNNNSTTNNMNWYCCGY